MRRSRTPSLVSITASSTLPSGSAVEGEDSDEVLGIILAGVHSWNEAALEQLVCRPLLPVAGRPLITHILEWLRHSGIQTVRLCANSDTSTFRSQLGNRGPRGMRLEYYEDVMPRGPAGCVKDASIGSAAREFVVVDGTILPRFDLGAALEAHRQSGSDLTLVSVHHPREPGEPALDPETAGVYIFSPAALEGISAFGYRDLKEHWIPQLYRCGFRLSTYTVPATHVPRVTDAGSYLAVNQWAVAELSRCCEELPRYRRVEEAWVHDEAQVHAGARLVGPVVVESKAVIESGVIVVGPAVIGTGCVLRRDSIVTCSVLWERCQLRPGAVVDHCVVISDAVVASDCVVRGTVWMPDQRRPLWQRLLGAPSARSARVRIEDACQAARTEVPCA